MHFCFYYRPSDEEEEEEENTTKSDTAAACAESVAAKVELPHKGSEEDRQAETEPRCDNDKTDGVASNGWWRSYKNSLKLAG